MLMFLMEDAVLVGKKEVITRLIHGKTFLGYTIQVFNAL